MGYLGKCARNEILAKKAKLADKFFSKKENAQATYDDFLKYYENFSIHTIEAKTSRIRYIKADFLAYVTMTIGYEEISETREFTLLVPDYIYTNKDTTELQEFIQRSDEYICACNPRINDVSELFEIARAI